MSSINYCVEERKGCVGWVETYFKDCLCNIKDEFSFGFGLISLVCWGVAEIPQIITNFRTKSSHGVSLLFLFTWVAGDIFNLTGCLLEPATVSHHMIRVWGWEFLCLFNLICRWFGRLCCSLIRHLSCFRLFSFLITNSCSSAFSCAFRNFIQVFCLISFLFYLWMQLPTQFYTALVI